VVKVNVETEKKIDSLLANIKSNLMNNCSDDLAIDFVEWTNKKLADTIKDKKEKQLLKQLKILQNNNCKTEDDKVTITKLINKKKNYAPKNYPCNLQVGDLVYVNFGFGYCSELSDGHYGIILSGIKANMYLVLPLSSESLRICPVYLDGLNLPNKDGLGAEKKSYLRFDQLRYLHYRRLENINGCGHKEIGQTNYEKVIKSLKGFLQI